MKLAVKFIKEHIGAIVMYAGFIGVFSVVFYLYELQSDAVSYAFLLSFIWFACLGIWDFIKYRSRHFEIMELERKLKAQWEELPKPRMLIEEDYQRILECIYKEKLEIESLAVINRQDMMDYYSLWVHQIKTPISAMRVLIQSQERQSAGDREVEIKALKMELFKIEQYVEMVLSYLRVESMSSDMVLQWYPVDGIVKQAVRKYSQLFILQKISLDLKPMEKMVLTDEKWLVLVIEQILSNALKYTKVGMISIYLKEGELVIEDTGIGIQQEDLPRVFEKGFTGFNGRRDKKSTGIGLYLCKSIMDKLNYGIRIESEVGRGTKVYLTLGRDELNPE